MRPHLPIAAGGLIVAYFLFQIWEDRQWQKFVFDNDCHVEETRDAKPYASIGLYEHPRVGISEGSEVWKCADGTRHVRGNI
jgi:hypothetical protein